MKFLKPPAPAATPDETWTSVPILLGIAIAVLVVALIYMWRRRRARIAAQRCQWRRAGGPSANLHKWYCQTCRQEAFSSGDKPPKECKRYLHSTAL